MSGSDQSLGRVGRVFALVSGLVGAVLLTLFFLVNYGAWGLSLPLALWRFFAYMTILTNIGLVLALVAAGLPGLSFLSFFRRPLVRAGLAGYILIVAIYYHVFLLPGADLGGLRAVPEIGLHYLMPTLFLVWLFVFAGRAEMPYRAAVALLIPPALYLVFVLVRGAVTGQYPYDIVDVSKVGYGGVALATLAFVVIFLVFNAAGIALTRFALRRTG